jgi:predicted metal-binding protein
MQDDLYDRYTQVLQEFKCGEINARELYYKLKSLFCSNI